MNIHDLEHRKIASAVAVGLICAALAQQSEAQQPSIGPPSIKGAPGTVLKIELPNGVIFYSREAIRTNDGFFIFDVRNGLSYSFPAQGVKFSGVSEQEPLGASPAPDPATFMQVQPQKLPSSLRELFEEKARSREAASNPNQKNKQNLGNDDLRRQSLGAYEERSKSLPAALLLSTIFPGGGMIYTNRVTSGAVLAVWTALFIGIGIAEPEIGSFAIPVGVTIWLIGIPISFFTWQSYQEDLARELKLRSVEFEEGPAWKPSHVAAGPGDERRRGLAVQIPLLAYRF